MTAFLCHRFKIVNRMLMLAYLLVSVSFSIFAQAEDCLQVLPEAEKQYKAAYYDLAIHLLEDCLANQGFTEKEQLVEAYSILARAYLAGDYPQEKAEQAIDHILLLDGSYRPATPENPNFEYLVKQKRQQLAKKRRTKWFVLGGVAAAGITTVVFFATRGSGNELPGPPELPSD